MNDYKRPTWDEYFFEVLEAVSKRGTCDRAHVGCVIVKDNQILSTGYNGSVCGAKHCDEVGHLMKKVIHDDGSISQHCVRTVHAEQNAICQAAKHGVALKGATLYCGMTPCRTCAMLIVQCGIKEVKCQKRYHSSKDAEGLFADAGIKLSFVEDSVAKYSNQ